MDQVFFLYIQSKEEGAKFSFHIFQLSTFGFVFEIFCSFEVFEVCKYVNTLLRMKGLI